MAFLISLKQIFGIVLLDLAMPIKRVLALKSSIANLTPEVLQHTALELQVPFQCG